MNDEHTRPCFIFHEKKIKLEGVHHLSFNIYH